MKFVIATGGSGGHLFPSIQVANELSRQGHAIVFLGSFKRANDHIQKAGFTYEELNAKGFVLPPRKGSLGSIVAMIKAVVKAFRSLKKNNPCRPDASLIAFPDFRDISRSEETPPINTPTRPN